MAACCAAACGGDACATARAAHHRVAAGCTPSVASGICVASAIAASHSADERLAS